MIISSKIFTLLAWILIIFNVISPINGFSEMLNWTGIGLAAAHCIETLVFLPKAKKLGGNLPGHIIQLLIFGYVYNMEMDKLLAGKN